MKKSILNIGTALKKAEQKLINGGTNGYCGGWPSYNTCFAVCNYGTTTCQFTACGLQEYGWLCVPNDRGGNNL